MGKRILGLFLHSVNILIVSGDDEGYDEEKNPCVVWVNAVC